jgi:hypothetical protein
MRGYGTYKFYQFFYLPTDAQESCFKRILKFTLTAPTSFGAITIIRERIL